MGRYGVVSCTSPKQRRYWPSPTRSGVRSGVRSGPAQAAAAQSESNRDHAANHADLANPVTFICADLHSDLHSCPDRRSAQVDRDQSEHWAVPISM